MTLKVHHDGSLEGEMAERCCMCRAKTYFWHASDVALCPDCAKTTKLADLPTKQAWCNSERALSKKRMTPENLPPAEIIDAAEKVGRWFAEHNIKNWSLGPCKAR